MIKSYKILYLQIGKMAKERGSSSKRKAKLENNKLMNAIARGEDIPTHVTPSQGDTLWDNPMVRNAKAKMTPEQLAEYERKGEEMYGNMDFDNLGKQVNVAALMVKEYIKGGLHPSYLNNDERAVMESKYGKEWYTQFGYTKEEIVPTAIHIDELMK